MSNSFVQFETELYTERLSATAQVWLRVDFKAYFDSEKKDTTNLGICLTNHKKFAKTEGAAVIKDGLPDHNWSYHWSLALARKTLAPCKYIGQQRQGNGYGIVFSSKEWQCLVNITDWRWSWLDICVYFWQSFCIGWEDLIWLGKGFKIMGDIWSYLVLSNMVGKYRISFDLSNVFILCSSANKYDNDENQ